MNWKVILGEIVEHATSVPSMEVFGIVFTDGHVLRCPNVPKDLAAGIKLIHERVATLGFENVEAVYTSHCHPNAAPTFKDFAQSIPGKRYIICAPDDYIRTFRSARAIGSGHPYLVPESPPQRELQ